MNWKGVLEGCEGLVGLVVIVVGLEKEREEEGGGVTGGSVGVGGGVHGLVLFVEKESGERVMGESVGVGGERVEEWGS